MNLNACVNRTERTDRAAAWATRHEYRMRRAWWRRIRFSPTINGFVALTEAFNDLARVVGRREESESEALLTSQIHTKGD